MNNVCCLLLGVKKNSIILKKTTKPATPKTLKKINSDVHVYMSCQSNMLNKKGATTMYDEAEDNTGCWYRNKQYDP